MSLYCFASRGVINPSGAPNEGVVTILPREFKKDGTRRALLVLAGHNGTSVTPLVTSQYLQGSQVFGDIAAALALGMPVVTIDAGGGTLFGNDTAIARANEAMDWIVSSGLGKAGVILAGTSMGSILGVNVAVRYPSKVAALALFYPAMDLQYVRDHQTNSEVDNAYGGSFSSALATHGAIQQAGSLQVPVKGYFGDPDTVTNCPASWNSFKAALPSPPQEYDLGNVGHGDNTILPLSDIQTFFAAHA